METGIELKKSHKNSEICSENIEKDLSTLSLCNVEEKCASWLDNYTSDNVSVCSEFTETSGSSLFTDTTENSAMDSGYVFENQDVIIQNKICCAENVSFYAATF